MATRHTSVVKDKEFIDKLVSIKPEDITSSFVMECFGEFDGKVRCNPYDLITVPKGTYGIENSKRGLNKNDFTTTCGCLIFNKLYIARNPSIYEIYGWVDDIMTKKAFGKLYKNLGYLLLEGEIEREDFKRFAMTTQLTMPYVQFLSPGFTDKMLLSGAQMTKSKNKKIKEHQAEIDAVDLVYIDKMKKELLDEAEDLLKDDPSYDMFASGAGGSWENNYGSVYIGKMSVRDPDPNKGYNFIRSNYIDGVSVEEYAALANTLAEGPFSRSKKTEVGGYWEKLFVSSLQHLQLDEPGSDCGTKRYIVVTITKDNIDEVMYNYIIQGDKLVEITSKNRESLIGKTVKMRYSSMCKHPNGFCNKCAGNLWYRLGMRNVGVITPQIPSKYKNMAMKLFHDSTIKMTDMNVFEAFCPDEVLRESPEIYTDDVILEEAIPEGIVKR